mgnify:CR=1 FL=1
MKVLINKEHGWSQYKDRETCVWFKGHGIKKNFSLLIDWISKFNKYQNLSEVKHSYICRFINTLSGHFSIIIKMPIGVIMIVDKVNSMSLYYAKCKNEIIVGNNVYTSGIVFIVSFTWYYVSNPADWFICISVSTED